MGQNQETMDNNKKSPGSLKFLKQEYGLNLGIYVRFQPKQQSFDNMKPC